MNICISTVMGMGYYLNSFLLNCEFFQTAGNMPSPNITQQLKYGYMNVQYREVSVCLFKYGLHLYNIRLDLDTLLLMYEICFLKLRLSSINTPKNFVEFVIWTGEQSIVIFIASIYTDMFIVKYHIVVFSTFEINLFAFSQSDKCVYVHWVNFAVLVTLDQT